MTVLAARPLPESTPWTTAPRQPRRRAAKAANSGIATAGIATTEIATTGDGNARADDLSIRLLRHHTKNALQRVLAEVSKVRGIQDARGGRRLVEELERRVMLSVSLSDALFGLTHAPADMEDRLRSACETTLELMADPDQVLRLEVAVEGDCPPPLRATLLRAAHEMVGNAVKHGLHARLLGHVRVHLSTHGGTTRLAVEDDGWGYAGARDGGEGLGLLRSLAGLHDGTMALHRIQDGTRAAMDLPHPPG